MPYFVMAALYLAVALLIALGASLASLGIVPWFAGLRWLRVHLLTVGVLTQLAFGLLPGLAATRMGRPWPKFRGEIWALLNTGLIVLLIGVPLVNPTLIIAGGALVFTATLLLLHALKELRVDVSTFMPRVRAGRMFYLAGFLYLLLGIFLGTGMWLGWGQALNLANPKEVHVHTNLWGFTALLFAGLLVDLYPEFASRQLAWPRSRTAIFWLMTVGALGLVVGPWIQVALVSTVGLILHTAGTLWLLANVIRPLLGDRAAWTPGMLHLVTSYTWILVPTVVAPLIVINAPNFPVAQVEQNGGPILIYGWMMQFGYAIIPYVFSRAFLPNEPATLGGTWFTLIAVHLGGIFFWMGLFVATYQGVMHGVAFGLWSVSLLPILARLWRTTHSATIDRSNRSMEGRLHAR